jgi:hypothetical protein
MADVLKEHIEQCPEHPLSAAVDRIEWLEDYAESIYECLAEGDAKEAMSLVKRMNRKRILERVRGELSLPEAKARIKELEDAARSALWNLEEGADVGAAMEYLDEVLPEEEGT